MPGEPWPTPVAQDAHGHAQTKEHPTPGQTGGTTLAGAALDWPTPTAETYGSNRGGSAGRTGPVRPSLEAAVRDWPTPVAADGERASETYYRGAANPTLLGAVREWPTPRASDGEKGSAGQSSQNGPSLPAAAAKEPFDFLPLTCGTISQNVVAPRLAYPDRERFVRWCVSGGEGTGEPRGRSAAQGGAGLAAEPGVGRGVAGVAPGAHGPHEVGARVERSRAAGAIRRALALRRRPLNRFDWPALGGLWLAPRGAAQAPWEPPRTCGRGEVQGRSHQLRAIGNSWCVAQALLAWRLLVGEE